MPPPARRPCSLVGQPERDHGEAEHGEDRVDDGEGGARPPAAAERLDRAADVDADSRAIAMAATALPGPFAPMKPRARRPGTGRRTRAAARRPPPCPRPRRVRGGRPRPGGGCGYPPAAACARGRLRPHGAGAGSTAVAGASAGSAGALLPAFACLAGVSEGWPCVGRAGCRGRPSSVWHGVGRPGWGPGTAGGRRTGVAGLACWLEVCPAGLTGVADGVRARGRRGCGWTGRLPGPRERACGVVGACMFETRRPRRRPPAPPRGPRPPARPPSVALLRAASPSRAPRRRPARRQPGAQRGGPRRVEAHVRVDRPGGGARRGTAAAPVSASYSTQASE